MLRYRSGLRELGRQLRSAMTDGEHLFWSRLRGKQVLGVQFYRQRPVGNFIVDFCTPEAGVVIEIDGSQHLEPEHREKDRQRDEVLSGKGFKVLRFDSRQVMVETEGVMEVIYREVGKRLEEKIP